MWRPLIFFSMDDHACSILKFIAGVVAISWQCDMDLREVNPHIFFRLRERRFSCRHRYLHREDGGRVSVAAMARYFSKHFSDARMSWHEQVNQKLLSVFMPSVLLVNPIF